MDTSKITTPVSILITDECGCFFIYRCYSCSEYIFCLCQFGHVIPISEKFCLYWFNALRNECWCAHDSIHESWKSLFASHYLITCKRPGCPSCIITIINQENKFLYQLAQRQFCSHAVFEPRAVLNASHHLFSESFNSHRNCLCHYLQIY